MPQPFPTPIQWLTDQSLPPPPGSPGPGVSSQYNPQYETSGTPSPSPVPTAAPFYTPNWMLMSNPWQPAPSTTPDPSFTPPPSSTPYDNYAGPSDVLNQPNPAPTSTPYPYSFAGNPFSQQPGSPDVQTGTPDEAANLPAPPGAAPDVAPATLPGEYPAPPVTYRGAASTGPDLPGGTGTQGDIYGPAPQGQNPLAALFNALAGLFNPGTQGPTTYSPFLGSSSFVGGAFQSPAGGVPLGNLGASSNINFNPMGFARYGRANPEFSSAVMQQYMPVNPQFAAQVAGGANAADFPTGGVQDAGLEYQPGAGPGYQGKAGGGTRAA